MIERGEYSGIYVAVLDDGDFNEFQPGGKLLFFLLKLMLGASGIRVVPALVPTLVERSGAEERHVLKGLEELKAAGWLKIERNVVWLVNGLRYNPGLSLENANHRQKIRRHLDGLPRLAIVDEYRAHYGIAAPPPDDIDIPVDIPSSGADSTLESQSSDRSMMGSKMGSLNPSKDPSENGSKDPSPIREEVVGRGKTEEGKDSSPRARRRGKQAEGTATAKRETWLTPFDDDWRAVNGGAMPAGKAARSLAKLVEAQGFEETRRRWRIYLAAKGEYASPAGFSSTWGHWDRPRLRASQNGAASSPVSAADALRVEAGNLVQRIRDLVYEQPIPGQGSKRLLRLGDIEALGVELGEPLAAALRTVGGVARVLKLDQDASDFSFLVRDFGPALLAARAAAANAPPADEAQSA
jgi:hypothetical protein